MGTRRVAALLLLTSLVSVAGAGAKQIAGSARADTLRGTAGADVLYGKAGRDRLFGGAGNDLLVPGAGADEVRCGPGRDTVRADGADLVASDCEAVVRPGAYAGLTTQNERLTLRVEPGSALLTAFRVNSVNQSCQPPDRLAISGALDHGAARFAIGADGSFVATYAGPGKVSGRVAAFTIRTKGTFARTTVHGTTRFDMTFTDDGTEYSCSSGAVGWEAGRG